MTGIPYVVCLMSKSEKWNISFLKSYDHQKCFVVVVVNSKFSIAIQKFPSSDPLWPGFVSFRSEAMPLSSEKKKKKKRKEKKEKGKRTIDNTNIFLFNGNIKVFFFCWLLDSDWLRRTAYWYNWPSILNTRKTVLLDLWQRDWVQPRQRDYFWLLI